MEDPRQGAEHLIRGSALPALLQARVVVDADTGQHRHLLTSQAGRPATITGLPQPHLIRSRELAPSAEKLTQTATHGVHSKK
ncbi:hypothetical protein Pmi06nite_38620 [Planotetraspora mira]|uniref:Uncharacterized protein n=1 Tax=Planotetraspora mira TaxID=58121 RepID=A0A8J3U085_9ACTN|nr:hypothetical protein Pmi06nite_38620 [Planotetraspora mira]